jgi:putative (di)nucleoside polyphosphate hydrolase
MTEPPGKLLRPRPKPSDGYRPCVGVMLVNRAGLVFVGHRIGLAEDAWQMPQGGVDKGEDPADAAMRELEEEIGTGKARIIAESEGWFDYDLPPEFIGKRWRGKYRGQSQKWFACLFEGEDEDIQLDTDHPEFSDWRWVGLDELADLIIEFKRDVYRAVVADFAPKIKQAIEQRHSKSY